MINIDLFPVWHASQQSMDLVLRPSLGAVLWSELRLARIQQLGSLQANNSYLIQIADMQQRQQPPSHG